MGPGDQLDLFLINIFMIFDDAIASTRRGVLEQVDIENSIGTSITD